MNKYYNNAINPHATLNSNAIITLVKTSQS